MWSLTLKQQHISRLRRRAQHPLICPVLFHQICPQRHDGGMPKVTLSIKVEAYKYKTEKRWWELPTSQVCNDSSELEWQLETDLWESPGRPSLSRGKLREKLTNNPIILHQEKFEPQEPEFNDHLCFHRTWNLISEDDKMVQKNSFHTPDTRSGWVSLCYPPFHRCSSSEYQRGTKEQTREKWN